MKKTLILSLCSVIICLSVSCTPDRKAYESCKQTLSRSMEELTTAKSVKELEEIDRGVTDTLAKYGHSKMSSEMLDEIRTELNEYKRRWTDFYEKALRKDSLYMNRIKDIPGVGAVEFKAPPEV